MEVLPPPSLGIPMSSTAKAGQGEAAKPRGATHGAGMRSSYSVPSGRRRVPVRSSHSSASSRLVRNTRESCRGQNQSGRPWVGLGGSMDTSTSGVLEKSVSVHYGCPKAHPVTKEALSETLPMLKDQRCAPSQNADDFSSTKRHLQHPILTVLSPTMPTAGPGASRNEQGQQPHPAAQPSCNAWDMRT